jgi:hypothetical protein
VVPADGGPEIPCITPFRAHLTLDQLNAEGDIELYTPENGRRDVVAHRRADGYWETPDDYESGDREEEAM